MLTKLNKFRARAFSSRRSGRLWRLGLALVMLAAIILARADWPFGPQISGGTITGHADVRDGDSLVIGRERIRLDGIDAPELAQTCIRNGTSWPCGSAAHRHLARLIGNHDVTCQSARRDQHNRLLARCTSAGRDLNRSMVRDGMAVSFGRDYAREEAAAKNERLGLWAGTFERPQAWRRENMNR